MRSRTRTAPLLIGGLALATVLGGGIAAPDRADAAASATAPAVASPDGRLTNLAHLDFLLDQATTSAGRHPDSDIFLDDVTVSRRHAEFRLESAEFQVVDVGSLNGTYVNREPVDSAVLANGDEVQIGKFRLVFLTGPRTDDDGGPSS